MREIENNKGFTPTLIKMWRSVVLINLETINSYIFNIKNRIKSRLRIKTTTSSLVSGFTLIELLVVISIIGLLSSIVLTSLTEARGRARDAKWLTELNQIKTAMSIYKNDTGYYPGDDGTAYGSDNFQNALSDLVVRGYFDDTEGIPLPNDTDKIYYFNCEHWNTSGISGYSNCIDTFPGYTAEGYVIVFNTESMELDLPTFYSLGYYTGSID